VVSSGFRPLDAYLPGGGWPLGALTEILIDDIAHSPLWLVLPGLLRLTALKHHQIWVYPPHIPYPPALASRGINLDKTVILKPRQETDALWAAEQALRSGACSAVLYWPRKLSFTATRRLQLASEVGSTWGLCFRPSHAATMPTTAALRLLFKPTGTGAMLTILKCRGGKTEGKFAIYRDTMSPFSSKNIFDLIV
jgi:cell division inhibitor SulA/protein ImuA